MNISEQEQTLMLKSAISLNGSAYGEGIEADNIEAVALDIAGPIVDIFEMPENNGQSAFMTEGQPPQSLHEKFRQSLMTAEMFVSDFDRVYEGVAPGLIGYLIRYVGSREEAEDLSHEVFIKVHQNISRYDEKKASFATWFYNVATRMAIDAVRRTNRRPKRALDDSRSPQDILVVRPSGEPSPETEVFNSFKRTMIKDAFDRLGDKSQAQREVLELQLEKEMTQGEIAEYLGIPLGTVKTRTRLGLAKMRDDLREDYDFLRG